MRWSRVDNKFFSDYFVVFIYNPAAQNWFLSLVDDQKDELARLEAICTHDDGTLETEIVRDWIEEHGGERWWRSNVFSYKVV